MDERSTVRRGSFPALLLAVTIVAIVAVISISAVGISDDSDAAILLTADGDYYYCEVTSDISEYTYGSDQNGSTDGQSGSQSEYWIYIAFAVALLVIGLLLLWKDKKKK